MPRVPPLAAIGASHQFYADTNVFRGLAEGRLNVKRWYQFIERLRELDGAMWYSIITIQELIPYIQPGHPDAGRIRGAFQHIVKTCENHLLPQPDWELRNAFCNAPEDNSHLHTLLSITQSIARAEKPNALSHQLRVRLQAMRHRHEVLERNWLGLMINLVEGLFGKGGLVQLRAGARGGLQDEALRRRYMDFLDGPILNDTLAEAFILRSGKNTATEEERALAKSEFGWVIAIYKQILRQIGMTGYDPVKRQNDFEDMLLMFHLRRLPFVSDERFHDKIGGAGPEEGRILTPAQVCSEYGIVL